MIKHNKLNGTITLMTKRIDDLNDLMESYEAQGYEPIIQKSNYMMYRPFWHPGKIAVDMRKNKGQLEMRLYKGG